MYMGNFNRPRELNQGYGGGAANTSGSSIGARYTPPPPPPSGMGTRAVTEDTSRSVMMASRARNPLPTNAKVTQATAYGKTISPRGASPTSGNFEEFQRPRVIDPNTLYQMGPGAYMMRAADDYSDEMFAGLEGAVFKCWDNVYRVKNGELQVMEGCAISSRNELAGLEALAGLEGWNPFKSIGKVFKRVIQAPKRILKEAKRFVKTDLGKAVVGIGLAVTGVGLVGMYGYGAATFGAGIKAGAAGLAKSAAAYGAKAWTGVKAGAGKVAGWFGGGSKAGFGAQQAASMAKGAVGMGSQVASTAGAATSGGGWLTAAGLESAVKLGTTALSAYTQFQTAKANVAMAEAGAGGYLDPYAGGGVPAMDPYAAMMQQGGGGGGGGGGGLTTDLAPGSEYDPDAIPDVTPFAQAGMSMPLLLLGGGLLLTMALRGGGSRSPSRSRRR